MRAYSTHVCVCVCVQITDTDTHHLTLTRPLYYYSMLGIPSLMGNFLPVSGQTK